jgi:hypothetical protein
MSTKRSERPLNFLLMDSLYYNQDEGLNREKMTCLKFVSTVLQEISSFKFDKEFC